LAIIVPYDEVLERKNSEEGEVIWTAPPPEGACIHFDVIYVPANAVTTSHPGARSMGTKLVGEVRLENNERVFVTSIVRPMEELLRSRITKMRKAPLFDANWKQIEKTGMLSFGTEPNSDAADDTRVGVLLAVTRARNAKSPTNGTQP
jgi:hypothetical protein